MSKNFYGIMIKYPEPGKVKTRLAEDIGHEKAALICKQVAEQVMKQTMPPSSEYSRFVFYDPSERIQDFITWLQDEKFILQKGRDVGERMDNVIRHLLDNGAEKAVITGADIPDLNSQIIMQAFELLEHSDIVIGPARDGGYYLIGMKTTMPELFVNIQWSTGDVLAETVKIISQLQKSYRTVAVLSDLDTIEDFDHIVK